MERRTSYEYLDKAPTRERAQSLLASSRFSKMSVGIQTIIPPRNYIPPSIAASHQLSLLDYPKFLYMPHTITFLVLSLVLVIYCAFKYNDAEIPFIYCLQRSVIAMAGIFLLYAAIYFPDTVLNRPHPVFWRLIQGACCLYLLFVIFILFLDLDTARQVMKYIDPRLGSPLPEKSYADDCRLYTPENPHSKFANLMDAMDMYIVSHWFGWWFKTLIFRDAYICIYLSITFEGLELTFKHWIPNFAECWWDSLILDILLCNLVGIILGHLTCKYLELGNFKWFGKHKKSYYTNELAKLFSLLHPNEWSNYNWHMFDSLTNFLGVLWIIIVNDVTDLNNFFLKYVLWVPANHWTLLIRILILGFLGLVAVKEYYMFLTNKEYRRFSSSIWLMNFIFLAELAIWLKFGSQIFTEPFPTHVIVAWLITGIVFIITVVVLFVRDMHKKPKKEVQPFDPYNPPVDIEYVKQAAYLPIMYYWLQCIAIALTNNNILVKAVHRGKDGAAFYKVQVLFLCRAKRERLERGRASPKECWQTVRRISTKN
eukprot:TRINITY_DN1940_c0_g1_i1.p2 TRINITY_DN1940_c0_g1~~TRINITY_DN1940_c0_g1_i1.p2  ORF type:complete len:539 (-),score=20.74 TRINITY_DN1940_c0_g1_i1:1139-2755(-)